MTSAFDRQTNCLTEPERELVFGFLLIHLDPFTPGMLKTAYDSAWLGYGAFGEKREAVFRGAFALYNLSIGESDFVVSGVPSWFTAWANSISSGASNPSDPCPCDSF